MLRRILKGLLAPPVVVAGVVLVFLCAEDLLTCCSQNHGVPHKAREAQCKATMAGFIIGMRAYQEEYRRMPVEFLGGQAGLSGLQPTRGVILKVLHPDQAETDPTKLVGNPRRIIFYDPKIAKAKKNGAFLDEHGAMVLVDPWGEPFYFACSSEEKPRIPNPDPRDSKEHPFIEASVILFSSGPDRDPKTWKDNVMSWK